MRQLRLNFFQCGGSGVWGERKAFVTRLPAGQSMVVSSCEAKSLYQAAKSAGRRASVNRVRRGSDERLFTVWGAVA